MTGSLFANLVEQIANAKVNKLYSFDPKLLHRMQHIFVNDHADLYVFSMRDIIKVLVGFDTINDFHNKKKFMDAIFDLVNSQEAFSDHDYLELLNILDAKGYLGKNDDLIIKCRFYF